MIKPKAFGTFVRRGNYVFRTSAYIQWGDSDTSIGACLLLNPGSATLDDDLIYLLDAEGLAEGWIKTEDPTMEQLILFVQRIYGKDNPVRGRLHIYNLFSLQNTKSENAIDQFESLVQSGQYDISESLVTPNELRIHPWIFLGWGVKQEKKWKNLKLVKEKWLSILEESKVPTFGKKHEKRNDYYHPCPLIPTQRLPLLEELVSIYKKKFFVEIIQFPRHATKPNILVESKQVESYDTLEYGWFRTHENPEAIVNGFSHLKIKDGYKLRAYQFSDGGNGNGIVWAIPIEKELPEPQECERLDNFLDSPKPPFALSDFMKVIEGDKTPLSYLQASVVFHELHEFGAIWHGTSWGRDVILPLEKEVNGYDYEWEMIEEEPDIIEPHFYFDNEGHPVVVFYTINDIGTVTLKKYVHKFSKDDYSLKVEVSCIATAGSGIIF